MATCTLQALVDLDGSGAFATDITAYWWRQNGLALSGLGRRSEHDSAGSQTLNIHLDNRDGRFTPKNGSSPYASGGVNLFRPYIQIWIKATFNSITYELFKGVVTMIQPVSTDSLLYLTAQDYMYVLSRTDVKRPLMRDQFTGVIIHRLIDDAEGADDREKVANPRFETDITGWTITGSATASRVTVEPILESAAALKVQPTAVNGGVRYTFPANLAGQKVTASAYLKPVADADIGSLQLIRLGDSTSGVLQSEGFLALERDHWVSQQVTATFTGGSATQYMEIVRFSAGDFQVGAAHCVPFVNAITRTIDQGQSRLARFSYHRGDALAAIQEIRKNELGGLFYFNGAGVAQFEDRHHRWKGDHLTSTVTLTEKDPVYSEHAEDRIKDVVFDYPRYVDGEAGTVIWDDDELPLGIPAGGTLKREADYGGALVRNTITPVANIDYFVNAAADGSGVDKTGSITLVFNDFGGGSQGVFTNSSSAMVYLTEYQIRGTPIREASGRNPARATVAGGPALASTLSYDYPLNASEPDVQAWADYIAGRYGTQRERLSQALGAAFPEAALTSDMVSILARQISDRVTVVSTALPFAPDVNGDYYIDSITRRINGSDNQGYHLSADWRLSPVDDDYWILGTDRLETSNESKVAA